MSNTRIADDYASIAQLLKQIEAEKKPTTEIPEVKPDYSVYGWPYTATTDSDPA